MELSPSWEANQFSSSQEIPCNLQNLKVHYHIYTLPPVPILSQLDPVHAPTFPLFRSYHCICPGPRLSVWAFHNMICFYAEELLAPRPTPKLEIHPMLAVHDCLFSIFTATLHVGGRSSICNLRMCHALVAGTHLSQVIPSLHSVNYVPCCIAGQQPWYFGLQ